MSVKEEAHRLKAYKALHGFSSGEAYQAIYQRVCSKRTDSIVKKTNDPVLKAADFVNRIDDDTLLVVASAILYILSRETKEAPDSYSDVQRSMLSTMVNGADEAKEQHAIQLLAEAGIVIVDLCGDLHLVR